MYSRLLACLDLDLAHEQDDLNLIKKSLAISTSTTQIHLVHACEHPITGYGETTGQNHRVTESQIRQDSYPLLKSMADHFNIPCDNIHLPFGNPAATVSELAQELGCDLILVGDHGRSAMKLLLGSTANNIIHSAKCDVLTVKAVAAP